MTFSLLKPVDFVVLGILVVYTYIFGPIVVDHVLLFFIGVAFLFAEALIYALEWWYHG